MRHQKLPFVGTTWEHYRNREHYIVQAVPVNPNTGDKFVVYSQPGAGSMDYVRPFGEFTEKFRRVE